MSKELKYVGFPKKEYVLDRMFNSIKIWFSKNSIFFTYLLFGLFFVINEIYIRIPFLPRFRYNSEIERIIPSYGEFLYSLAGIVIPLVFISFEIISTVYFRNIQIKKMGVFPLILFSLISVVIVILWEYALILFQTTIGEDCLAGEFYRVVFFIFCTLAIVLNLYKSIKGIFDLQNEQKQIDIVKEELNKKDIQSEEIDSIFSEVKLTIERKLEKNSDGVENWLSLYFFGFNKQSSSNKPIDIFDEILRRHLSDLRTQVFENEKISKFCKQEFVSNIHQYLYGLLKKNRNILEYKSIWIAINTWYVDSRISTYGRLGYDLDRFFRHLLYEMEHNEDKLNQIFAEVFRQFCRQWKISVNRAVYMGDNEMLISLYKHRLKLQEIISSVNHELDGPPFDDDIFSPWVEDVFLGFLYYFSDKSSSPRIFQTLVENLTDEDVIRIRDHFFGENEDKWEIRNRDPVRQADHELLIIEKKYRIYWSEICVFYAIIIHAKNLEIGEENVFLNYMESEEKELLHSSSLPKYLNSRMEECFEVNPSKISDMFLQVTQTQKVHKPGLDIYDPESIQKSMESLTRSINRINLINDDDIKKLK